MAEGSEGAVTLLCPQEEGVCGLLSLSEVIFESCIIPVQFVRGTELSCNIPAALRGTAEDRHAAQCLLRPVVSLCGVCQSPPLPEAPGAAGDTKWGPDLHIQVWH